MKIGKFLWEKVKLGKCSTKYEQFLKIGGNMKQGEMHQCFRGEWTPLPTNPTLPGLLTISLLNSFTAGPGSGSAGKEKDPILPTASYPLYVRLSDANKATYLLTLVNCGNDHKHLFTVVIMHADICRPIGHNSPRFSHLCFSGCPCLSVSLSVYLSLYLSQGTSL